MIKLHTIEDQVDSVEKQAEALQLEIDVKMQEYKKLRTEVRKLKLLHAEKFYRMSAAECRAAYDRVQDLVYEDRLEPGDALRRRNYENPGKELTEAQYQELMLSFAGADYGHHS